MIVKSVAVAWEGCSSRLERELLSGWGRWGKAGSRWEPWVVSTPVGAFPAWKRDAGCTPTASAIGGVGGMAWLGGCVGMKRLRVDAHSSSLPWRQNWRILTFFFSPLPQFYWEVKVKVAQLCPTLCDPIDYTVHGILPARILEWAAVPFSTGSSQPRDRTQVSCIAGRFFTSWATREAQEYWSG